MSKKVTIEITPEKYNIKVDQDGNLCEMNFQKTLTGSKSTKGNFEDEDIISNELYYALEEAISASYSVMQNL